MCATVPWTSKLFHFRVEFDSPIAFHQVQRVPSDALGDDDRERDLHTVCAAYARTPKNVR